MDFPKVQSAIRSGGWEVEGVGYRRQAQLCLRWFEQRAVLLHEELDRLEAARKEGQTYKIPPELTEEYRLFWNATVVFAAMAVEGFLNYYGVKRLGEDFYSQNLERLSPARKLAAIVATCTGQLLPGDAELVTIIRRLADRRNSLVHPKAKEVKPKPRSSQWLISTTPWNPPADSVRDMERFFELFLQLDPQAIGAMSS